MPSFKWHKASGEPGATAPKGDIWFPIALGLIGLIIGYFLGVAQGNLTRGSAVAVVPTPAAPSVPTPSAPPTPAGPVALPVPAIDPSTDHIRGDKNAQIALIQYSDFECPFSKRVQPTYEQLLKTYNGKVLEVYRHFPLSFHQNAEKEAEASECVAELGGNDAFWKFHDGIFDKTTSNGTGFALADLAPLAKSVGVDQAKFTACLDSGKYAQKVKDEEDKASAGGVDGTPGNFVLNLKTNKAIAVTGAVPLTDFSAAIDQIQK